MSIELRTLPIDQLKPAAYNPRKTLRPGSPAYRKLKASIAEFGLVEPLVWNELTGHVVGGHARLKVLRELSFTEVPVSVVRLDNNREKALNIVLNNQEAQGRYDPTKLAAVLEELEGLPELEMSVSTRAHSARCAWNRSSNWKMKVRRAALRSPLWRMRTRSGSCHLVWMNWWPSSIW